MDVSIRFIGDKKDFAAAKRALEAELGGIGVKEIAERTCAAQVTPAQFRKLERSFDWLAVPRLVEVA